MTIRRSLIFAIIILLTLSLTGCGKLLPLFNNKKPEVVSNLASSSILLDNQAIRSQTLQIIGGARKTIFIELSVLHDQEIVNLLIAKAHSNVKVHILLDQWQRENTETVKTLKNENVSVQYYPAQKGQYQRLRYLVTDCQVAVFYGNDWTPDGFASHTLAIKLTGDTAWTMAKSFDKDWSYTTTLSLGLPESSNLPADNITFTSLNSGVKQQLLNKINAATTEILAEIEQVSDPETVDALVAAKKRGCVVRLIVSPSCAVATPNTIQKFKEAGIEIRYFNSANKQAMGINLGIFDNKLMVVTSSSWTYPAFVMNHEGALTIPSPAAAEYMSGVLKQEWSSGTLP
jgi:cardiolipin synthase